MHDSVEAYGRGACAVLGITDEKPIDKVFEIGSLNINGSARKFIPAREWVGSDILPGPGVDLVCSSHDLPDRHPELKESQWLVVCMEMLEHDSDPQKTFHTIHWLLKPFGVALLSARGPGFPPHRDAEGVEDYGTRFEADDFRALAFSADLHVCNVQPDLLVGFPGVFGMVRRNSVGVW